MVKVIICFFQCVKSRPRGWSWRGPAARERSQRRADRSDHTGRGSPPGLLVAGGQSAGSTCVSGLTCTARTMGKVLFLRKCILIPRLGIFSGTTFLMMIQKITHSLGKDFRLKSFKTTNPIIQKSKNYPKF